MNAVKQLNSYLLGEKSGFTLEEKLVLGCNLYCSLMCFVSIFINFLIDLEFFSVFLAFVSFIFFAAGFIWGRYFRRFNYSKLIFTIYTFIFCDIYWYVNYGSHGSAMYVFLLYYSLILFIWNSKQIRLITFLLALDLTFLSLLELKIPNLVPDYPSFTAKLADTYGTLLMILGFFFIFIVSVKNNYIKQFNMAQRSDMLKTAFLANMSHEIRTPLNAIMGFTKLFTTRELSKEKKEHYSQLITDNSKYLMQLLSDILDISLIESGQLKTTLSLIHLQNLFNKLFENHSYTLKEAGKQEVQLFVSIPSEVKFIESDEIRLEQILSNLIDNAIKFTSRGYIKFGYYTQEEETIMFIEDTGIGIREEFQPEIFNRFVKNEDNTDSNFVRGAGIGLSLTKELVEVLGGKIWFNSVYQEGSTFYLTFPQKADVRLH